MTPRSIQHPIIRRLDATSPCTDRTRSGPEDTLAEIQLAIQEQRWTEAAAVLNRQPDLFKMQPRCTLTLCAMGEHQLEDLLMALDPDVSLPSIRLENMDLQRGAALQQLVGSRGVAELHLQGCTLGATAWAGLAAGTRMAATTGQPGLSAFRFCSSYAPRWRDLPDITAGLSHLLDSVVLLDELELSGVNFEAGQVLTAMTGKVHHLTLDQLNGDAISFASEAEAPSPEVRKLTVRHWDITPGMDLPRMAMYRAMRALVAGNAQLTDLEVHSMEGNLAASEALGHCVAARTTPIAVWLGTPGGRTAVDRAHLWGQYQRRFLIALAGLHPEKRTGMVSALHLADIHLNVTGPLSVVPDLHELHIDPGSCLLPDEDRWVWQMQQAQRNEVQAMTSLRTLALTPPQQPRSGLGFPTAPDPRQVERDALWSPALNAVALRQVMGSHAIQSATVDQPQSMPPDPHRARQAPPEVSGLEEGNVGVENVEQE